MTEIITRDMGIAQVIQKYPELIPVFVQHGLGCIGCAMANFETIEQGAGAHGMDIDALMKDLNEVAVSIGERE
jgi:hybrid cluster-associated redox disulfide protein